MRQPTDYAFNECKIRGFILSFVINIVLLYKIRRLILLNKFGSAGQNEVK
jgi:hypothetical protein